MSQCACLLFFQDHGTKAGKGTAPTTDLRSLSPVRGDTGATSQAKLGKATLWGWEWVELVPLGPLLCSQHWQLADVLVLGRAEG